MNKIVVALPTRGLIFGRTVSSLIENKVDDICIVEGLPIPDCHNEAVQQALDKGATHVWMVEEDHYFPPDTLQKLLDLDTEVACANYPMRDGGKIGVVRLKDDKVWNCGMGCLLIRRSLFERMEKPYFRSDKTFNAITWEQIDKPSKYGGQDIYFGWLMNQMGVEIKQVTDFQVDHLRCSQLERKEVNDGCYVIRSIEKLAKP